ncbi:MAG: DMT family transporter, partial [Gemmobacter sp.]
MPETQSRPLLAFAWMLVAIASFTLMAVAGRAVQAELTTFQLMAWRSLIGLGIVCALILAGRRGFAQVRTRVPMLHLGRNLFHFTGQNLWFYGIMAIPLSQLVALEFTLPIWVALLAPLMLGERMTAAKLIAALVCFAGVLIVARPGVQAVGPGHAA